MLTHLALLCALSAPNASTPRSALQEPAKQEPAQPDTPTAKLVAAGASVQRIAQDSTELTVNFSIHGKQAGDDAVALVSELEQVVELNLGYTQVTAKGLESVGKLTGLRRLYLQETKVDDAALAHVASLSGLEYLNLYGTPVSDAGLKHLHGLTKLRKLYLWRTQVTEAGEKSLAVALPNVAIVRVLELPKAPVKDPLPAGIVTDSCCAKAHDKGEACAHDCCKAAVAAGKVCTKCNPPEDLKPAPKPAEEPAEKPAEEPKPKAKPVGLVAGSCCDKAHDAGKACAHPCCVKATAAGKVCTSCNPPKK